MYLTLLKFLFSLALVTYTHSQCVEIFGTLDRHHLLVIIYLSHH